MGGYSTGGLNLPSSENLYHTICVLQRLCLLKYLHEEEGVLQTRQPLGLEAEPRNRGLPKTESGAQSNKQTNKIEYDIVYNIFINT